MSPLIYLFVFIAGVTASSFGAIFGGGGFVVQLALLSVGLEAKAAVANDIAAAFFGAIVYLYTTKTKSKEITQTALRIAPGVILGALIGSYSLTLIPNEVVKWIILLVCVIGFIYVITNTRKKKSHTAPHPIRNWTIILPIAGIALGFYDGFLGAGGGILVIMALSMIMRKDMKATVSMANWVALMSLGTAALLYGYKGYLIPSLLIVMAPACMVGSFIAARIVDYVSEARLRQTYCAVVTALVIYLFYKEIWPLFVT